MSHPLLLVLLSIAALIVVLLGCYAAHLLLKLRQQKHQQQLVRQQRIQDIIVSIQTIAKAMEQQQCNYSEGAIRLCRLLESLPVAPRPDFKGHYPALFSLYNQVQPFATHQARKALPRQERERQDLLREEFEAELEASIIKELPNLTSFQL